jgi:hypothetical protein
MMNRSERVPTIEAFGTQLIETLDLDPLYVALVEAELPQEQMKRWLFAYWCCYHAGASSYLSERTGLNYWEAMGHMARNILPTPMGGRWPRGHERRHFRGDKAIEAVGYYTSLSYDKPEKMVDDFAKAGPKYPAIRTAVTTLPQFGPWIAFKVADMMERVLGIPVDFSEADVLMFDQPFKSAIHVYYHWYGDLDVPKVPNDKQRVSIVAQRLMEQWDHIEAPPRFDRMVGLQEVETILCKWKSHNTGHYPVGIDSVDLKAGLAEWAPYSETAQKLLVASEGLLG